MKDKYEKLKLENQLCFPLYAGAKEVIRRYKPFLDEIDLTYTQYIAMMILWEEECCNVKHIGQKLFLDSGTLTPLLKKLEKKGYINREKSKEDERNLDVRITDKGRKLRETALEIPEKMGRCICLSNEDMTNLYKILYKMLEGLESQ